MKKVKVVLKLNKETVANLNNDEMNNVKGGGGLFPTISRICNISLACSVVCSKAPLCIEPNTSIQQSCFLTCQHC